MHSGGHRPCKGSREHASCGVGSSATKHRRTGHPGVADGPREGWRDDLRVSVQKWWAGSFMAALWAIAVLGLVRIQSWRVARAHAATLCARRAAIGLSGVAALCSLGVEPSLANGNEPPQAKVTSGLEVLLQSGCQLLCGRKVSAGVFGGDRCRAGVWGAEPLYVLTQVGMVTNPTAVSSSLRHAVDLLHEQLGAGLVCVFGPEHGFRGTAQAGHSEHGGRDASTGLPVYDLYQLDGENWLVEGGGGCVDERERQRKREKETGANATAKPNQRLD